MTVKNDRIKYITDPLEDTLEDIYIGGHLEETLEDTLEEPWKTAYRNP